MDNRIKSDWDEIINRDRITATYKFALAKALVYLGDGRHSRVSFEELSYYYSRELCKHMRAYDKQSVFKSGKFLSSCTEHNAGEIEMNKLKELTVSSGIASILETFHNLDGSVSKTEFFKVDFSKKEIFISSEMVVLVLSFGRKYLLNQIEEKWNEIEKKWN